MRRLLCRLFGCHNGIHWIRPEKLPGLFGPVYRIEDLPATLKQGRWQVKCRWCGQWWLIPKE